MKAVSIRPALPGEAKPISDLIKSVARYFTLHPDGKGAEKFLLSIAPEAIDGYITNPSFNYLVGLTGQDWAGVVAVRDGKHLFHLFVAPQFQRHGIARQLLQAARSVAIASGNEEGFTVNSSSFAVAVYERLGFRATGPRVEKNGIAFVPMRLQFTNERG